MDLSTRYLGLTLKSPVVVSPSPLCEELDNLRQAEEAGAGAIVLHSLFEEQLAVESYELDRYLSESAESYAEALSYFPDMTAYNLGPEGYLDHLQKARRAVGIPVIASLNGVSTGGWTRYAKKMEEAGADALELNIYTINTDLERTAAEVEQGYIDLVREVKSSIGIPVAVKLAPFFSSMPNMARRLEQAGADGLVLFNRFYQPDFDLEAMEVVPSIRLSTSYELLLRIHWVAVLYGRIKADLAVTGGVHTSYDVLKAMMAGAQVAQMTSALLSRGVGYIATVLDELRSWMAEHEYESVRQMQGSMSQRAVANPAAFLRSNYMKVLSSYARA